MKPKPSLWLLVLAIAVIAGFPVGPSVARAEDTWENVERIVAIGDVHGDCEQFVTLLRQSGLIDENEDWIGGATHLVQVGDIPDRGPDSRKAMDLLMKLERQASKSKGYVHALIGNHEAMNVYGDLRYVHPGEYAAFQTPRSGQVRERAYEEHVRQIKDSQPRDQWPDFDGSYRATWEKDHPLGYFEHRQAFSPSGKYGKWIIGHNVIIKINDLLFLHGGIGPKYADSSVREINRQAREAFQDFKRLNGGILVDPEGPLWYRGLANNDEAAEEPHLEAVLNNFGVKRIVIGHTPTAGTVIPRFGGRVLIIDVGLSAVYGRRLACLVVEGGKFYCLHRGEKLPLPADSGPGLLEYLKKAASLDPQPSPLLSLITSLENHQQPVASSN
jgi:Calcineurin-like phosphoesterase